jgi:hypothetical protein
MSIHVESPCLFRVWFSFVAASTRSPGAPRFHNFTSLVNPFVCR